MSIEHLSAAVADAQTRVIEFEGKLADAQQLLAGLTVKRADATERAQAALQAVRSGELTEAVGGLRHSLALQDAGDLDALIAQGQSALAALINDVSTARDTAQRAQSALAAEERRLVVAGLKERIDAAEENLLRTVAEAHRQAGAVGGVARVWWPLPETIDMVMHGVPPRR